MPQSRLLTDILALLIVGLIIYMGYRIERTYRELRSEKINQEMTATGMDDQLATTVQQLETELAARQNYNYNQQNDPMDATKIIPFDFSDLYKYREMMEKQKVMRLSCTIIDANPSAIVKYMGRSHILHIGEEIDGKKVVEITQKAVKFSDGTVLDAQPAPTVQEIMATQPG